jgi:4-hydroxybenzoate polyprenyltransferase
LLWPTLWALWISSQGRPDPQVFLIFVCGVVLMRSAGCVVNDIADRNLDVHVERTRDRPIAAGRVSVAEALVLFSILAVLALMLALRLNRMSLLLAVIGALLTVTYPLLKRFVSVPQFYLGFCFGWGIPMAFAAQIETLPRIAWLLFIANLIWVVVYDTIYAMVDRADDINAGVRSTAILFGEADRHIVAILQLLCLSALYLAGRAANLGIWYEAGLACGAVFFIHELWLIRKRERAACFAAFLNSHYFGMAVFIGIALHFVFD